MRDSHRERTGTDPALDIRRLSGSLGAELRGIDLADPSPGDFDTILDLFAEHQVLLFPDQHLSTDEHLAFGRRFGTLEGHPHLTETSEVQEIFELRSSGGGVADEWHSDLTCMPEPSVMSIVQMVTCPDVGGDTMWSSQYAAYEQLSPPMQDLCEGLSALHDAHPHDRPGQMAIHPVVRVHPVTGRRSLFVNEHFTRRIVELSHDESEMLLGYLSRWAASPRFGVRYHWTAGTVAMWDNRCTQHCVLDDFDDERVLRRVTIMGDRPEPAVPPRWEPALISGARGGGGRHDRQLGRFLASQRGDNR
ncbi:MAG: TauD/TfdA family dioxygenase [Acidimicrobiia bacterium]|nr:TauD/TfdA family dioxygenase [Acidimicrobiia bacterium]